VFTATRVRRSERDLKGSTVTVLLTPSNFPGGKSAGTARDSARQTEYLQIDAPTSSTDTPSTFTITTTWTALP
jgi:hypothetical protein